MILKILTFNSVNFLIDSQQLKVNEKFELVNELVNVIWAPEPFSEL